MITIQKNDNRKVRFQQVSFTLFLLYLFILSYFLFVNETGYRYNSFLHQDKLIHFLAFFAGQLMIMSAAIKKSPLRRLVWSVYLLLPLIAEIIQTFQPYRVQSIWDMVSGYGGLLSGFIIYKLLAMFISKKTKGERDV